MVLTPLESFPKKLFSIYSLLVDRYTQRVLVTLHAIMIGFSRSGTCCKRVVLCMDEVFGECFIYCSVFVYNGSCMFHLLRNCVSSVSVLLRMIYGLVSFVLVMCVLCFNFYNIMIVSAIIVKYILFITIYDLFYLILYI